MPRTNALATQTRSIWEQVSSVRGQSLFEVVMAVGIAALILVAVVALATSSVRNSAFARNKTLATKYSQEATEWLREERDSSAWSVFYARATGAPYCLSSLSWTAPCVPITDTIFDRQAVLTASGSDAVDAVVTVTWTDSQGVHEVRNATMYTYWRK